MGVVITIVLGVALIALAIVLLKLPPPSRRRDNPITRDVPKQQPKKKPKRGG